MATVTIINARAGRDGEPKRVGDHDVLEFSVADSTKRGREEVTTWYNIKVWGNYAISLEGQVRKGDQVSVVGRLVERKYTDRDGNARTSLDVSADQVHVPYREREQEQTGGRPPAGRPKTEEPDDNLPF